jgi:hypothetical protein
MASRLNPETCRDDCWMWTGRTSIAAAFFWNAPDNLKENLMSRLKSSDQTVPGVRKESVRAVHGEMDWKEF